VAELLPESQWTEPDGDWCAHPEWWHSEGCDPAEAEVGWFLWGLVRLLQPELVVELGCRTGTSTVRLGEAVRDNGHGHVVAVEIGLEAAQEAGRVCADLPVTVVVADADRWAPSQPVDLLFVDTGPEGRGDLIRRLRPWLSTVVVHDTKPGRLPACELDVLRAGGVLGDVLTFRTPRGLTICEVVR